MIIVRDKKKCYGCGACVQACPVGCIAFVPDAEGFLYPLADKARCIQCGRCDAVCPCLNPIDARTPRKVLAVKNPDEATRMESSSGGVFSMLAGKVIGDGGVVFGAVFDGDWNVVHCEASDTGSLAGMRGSKYVQSVIPNGMYGSIKSYLDQGRQVLFSGTSCQTAALGKFLGRDYPGLYLVEIVCHGVPSPAVWQRYLREITEHVTPGAEITDIGFRDKSTGWKRFSLTVRGRREGTERADVIFSQPMNENAYMRGFLRNLYTRPACSRCPAKGFASGSDIALADFWGIGNFHPQMDDDRGTSLLFLNTPKGVSLFREAKSAAGEAVETVEASMEQVVAANPRIMRPAPLSRRRRKFFREFDRGAKLTPLIGRLTKRTLMVKAVYKIRKALGRA